MSSKTLNRAILVALVMTVVSCGDSSTPDSTVPSPATQAEMEVFCDKYESVQSESWSEMTAALIDVSPAEIKAQMVRTSEPPGDTWKEDQEAVQAFLERCNDQ